MDNIQAILPNHTDHSPKHIANVLDKAYELLGEDIQALTGVELFGLISAILFHDTGNIFGRNEHQHQIVRVYDAAWPNLQINNRDRFIVSRAGAAHCGYASDGSKNTLNDVDVFTSGFDTKSVRLREIAAILRFADELAEGPQRTSKFMQECGLYSDDSEIYHEYASATTVSVGKNLGRIALTYDVDVKLGSGRRLKTGEAGRLKRLIKYIYIRIMKLNEERQYARHYSEILSPFKQTTAVIKFRIENRYTDLGLEEFVLPDFRISETEQSKYLLKEYPGCKPAEIIKKIKEEIGRGDT